MAIRLVGEILSPSSCPMADVTITLEAVATSASVLLSSSASVKTDYKGRYDFVVPTGLYSVSLSHDAVSSPEDIGQIQVFSDSTESTLQALLDAPEEEPSPTWWQQIEEALAESKKHADAAAQSAADALASSEGVEAFSDAAKQHADRAANSASNSAKSATASEESAARAESAAAFAENAITGVEEAGAAAIADVNAIAEQVSADISASVSIVTDAASDAKVSIDKTASDAVTSIEAAADKADGLLPEILAEGEKQINAVKAEGSKFLQETDAIIVDATAEADRAKVEADRAKSEADRAAEIVGLDNVDAAVADAMSRAHVYAMTKAEFDALREKRKGDCAGSGFLEFGKTHPISGHYWKVNEGFWSGVHTAFTNLILMGDRETDAVGSSKTAYPVALIDGVRVVLNSMPANHAFAQAVLPPAPNGTKTYDSESGVVVDYSNGGTVAHNDAVEAAFAAETETNKVIVSRQDLVFLESWHQDTESGVLLPFGNAQFGANSWEGITLKKLTDLGVKQGFSAFGEWDDQTIGYGAKISDLTDEQLQKIISEPSNNIYYDAENKKLVQCRYRVRVVEGLGDEWLRPTQNSLDGGVAVSFANSALTRVAAVGLRDIADDYSDSRFFRQAKNANLSNADMGVAIHSAVADSYNGRTNFVPIALVQRLNSGCYHPSTNPSGCALVKRTGLEGGQVWHDSSITYTPTTKECFLSIPYDATDKKGCESETGKIGKKSGRTGAMQFHDAVYSSQVIDLRLSARKQDVNLLRENAIRAAVAGEMRGRGKVPFTYVLDVGADKIKRYNGGIFVTKESAATASAFEKLAGRTLANYYLNDFLGSLNNVGINNIYFMFDYNAKSYAVRLIKAGGGIDVAVVEDVGDNSFNEIPNVTVVDVTNLKVIMSLHHDFISQNNAHLAPTSEFDTVPWVDIIGTPENISKTFPNGVVGMWVPQIPDGTAKKYAMNRKCIGAGSAIATASNGETWVTRNEWKPVEGVENIIGNVEIKEQSNTVSLNFYETSASFTAAADNGVVIGSVGDVRYVARDRIGNGNRLMQSTINQIGKWNESHANRIVRMTDFEIWESNLIAPSVPSNHHQIKYAKTLNDSHAVKALSTITEKDGLLYLQLHGNELQHNGTDWGDDSTVPIINGEGTKEDANGNVVKTFCHHSMLPLGIADSSSSAISMRGFDKSGINDGLNLGLHFNTLDDVPDAIKEFYYQEEFILEEKYREEVKVDEESGEEYTVMIPDHIMGIRVIKYPHPHENGGHISAESIAAWEYHDAYKDWLTQCLEIQFQNSLPPETDENGEEVPHVELPFPSEPVREAPQ